jgi:hypothetical protein
MNRSRRLIVIGTALLVIGLMFVTYNRIALERTEKKAFGPFSVDVPRRKTFTMPKVIAWAIAVSGGAALVIGIRERKEG